MYSVSCEGVDFCAFGVGVLPELDLVVVSRSEDVVVTWVEAAPVDLVLVPLHDGYQRYLSAGDGHILSPTLSLS